MKVCGEACSSLQRLTHMTHMYVVCVMLWYTVTLTKGQDNTTADGITEDLRVSTGLPGGGSTGNRSTELTTGVYTMSTGLYIPLETPTSGTHLPPTSTATATGDTLSPAVNSSIDGQGGTRTTHGLLATLLKTDPIATNSVNNLHASDLDDSSMVANDFSAPSFSISPTRTMLSSLPTSVHVDTSLHDSHTFLTVHPSSVAFTAIPPDSKSATSDFAIAPTSVSTVFQSTLSNENNASAALTSPGLTNATGHELFTPQVSMEVSRLVGSQQQTPQLNTEDLLSPATMMPRPNSEEYSTSSSQGEEKISTVSSEALSSSVVITQPLEKTSDIAEGSTGYLYPSEVPGDFVSSPPVTLASSRSQSPQLESNVSNGSVVPTPSLGVTLGVDSTLMTDSVLTGQAVSTDNSIHVLQTASMELSTPGSQSMDPATPSSQSMDPATPSFTANGSKSDFTNATESLTSSASNAMLSSAMNTLMPVSELGIETSQITYLHMPSSSPDLKTSSPSYSLSASTVNIPSPIPTTAGLFTAINSAANSSLGSLTRSPSPTQFVMFSQSLVSASQNSSESIPFLPVTDAMFSGIEQWQSTISPSSPKQPGHTNTQVLPSNATAKMTESSVPSILFQTSSLYEVTPSTTVDDKSTILTESSFAFEQSPVISPTPTVTVIFSTLRSEGPLSNGSFQTMQTPSSIPDGLDSSMDSLPSTPFTTMPAHSSLPAESLLSSATDSISSVIDSRGLVTTSFDSLVSSSALDEISSAAFNFTSTQDASIAINQTVHVFSSSADMFVPTSVIPTPSMNFPSSQGFFSTDILSNSIVGPNSTTTTSTTAFSSDMILETLTSASATFFASATLPVDSPGSSMATLTALNASDFESSMSSSVIDSTIVTVSAESESVLYTSAYNFASTSVVSGSSVTTQNISGSAFPGDTTSTSEGLSTAVQQTNTVAGVNTTTSVPIDVTTTPADLVTTPIVNYTSAAVDATSDVMTDPTAGPVVTTDLGATDDSTTTETITVSNLTSVANSTGQTTESVSTTVTTDTMVTSLTSEQMTTNLSTEHVMTTEPITAMFTTAEPTTDGVTTGPIRVNYTTEPITARDTTEPMGGNFTTESYNSTGNDSMRTEKVDTTTGRPPFTFPPEVDLNTSSALADYWVVTEIQVTADDNWTTNAFKRNLELRLAHVYNQAIDKENGYVNKGSLSRRKRAETIGAATIQMTEIEEQSADSPLNINLIYCLVEDDSPNITAAARTVYLIHMFSVQEVAIMLGYVVLSQGETYLPAPPPPPSKMWIVGAVIGGVLGVIIIGWIILFIYFKCTKSPPKAVTPRSPRMASGDPNTDFKEIKGFDYVRTEVGMKGQNSSLYRNYPTGSTEYEGVYAPVPGETPPPKYQTPPRKEMAPTLASVPPAPDRRPHSGRGVSSLPQEDPIYAQVHKNTKSKRPASSQKHRVAKITEETGSSYASDEMSEDRMPLANKRRSKSKSKKKHQKEREPHETDGLGSGQRAGEFENVAKLSRVADDMSESVRSTVHPIHLPPLSQQQLTASMDMSASLEQEEEMRGSLKQKADIERYRNKQRLRQKKKGAKKGSKKTKNVGDSKEQRRAYLKAQEEITGVLGAGDITANHIPEVRGGAQQQSASQGRDDMEMEEMRQRNGPHPLLVSQAKENELGQLETDTSDEDYEEERLRQGQDQGQGPSQGQGQRPNSGQGQPETIFEARHRMHALLDQAFALVAPNQFSPDEDGSQSDRPVSQGIQPQVAWQTDQPPPTEALGPKHTPLYITPVTKQTNQAGVAMWSPYTAADQSAQLREPAQYPPGSISTPQPVKRPSSADSAGGMGVLRPAHSPRRAPHHYANPGFSGDSLGRGSFGVGSLQHTDLSGSQPQSVTDSSRFNIRTPQEIRKDLAPDNYTSVVMDSKMIGPTRADPDSSQDTIHTRSSMESTGGPYKPYSKFDNTVGSSLLNGHSGEGLPQSTHLDMSLYGEGHNGDTDLLTNGDTGKAGPHKPGQRDPDDDELDVVVDFLKPGTSPQPLLDSVRQELKRLAQRDDDSYRQQIH